MARVRSSEPRPVAVPSPPTRPPLAGDGSRHSLRHEISGNRCASLHSLGASHADGAVRQTELSGAGRRLSDAGERDPTPESVVGLFARIRSRRLGCNGRLGDVLQCHCMPDPIRLADSDPQRLAVAIVGYVTARVFHDARRLGLVLKTADGRGEQDGTPFLVMGSEIYRAALMLAEWAKTGRGDSAEIAAAILQVRADLEGIDIMQASPTRPLDPATLHGAALVAAGARLALVEGRTVTAIELLAASKKAGIDPLSPHALRKAAGQWLIDLGMPLELVSRVLGHADTRITETVYARVKDEDVTDRMLDAIDPRYAKAAHKARGKRKVVETIKKVPEPRSPRVLYAVAGIERTLVEWAAVSGLSKTTLFHRVVTSGMSMADALALEKGRRGKPLPVAPMARKLRSRGSRTVATAGATARFDSTDCRTGAADASERLDALDVLDAPRVWRADQNKREIPQFSVPRDGIEPPTRGFSIPCSTN
jgi:hypothetical protein